MDRLIEPLILLTFVMAQALGVVIAYRVWRDKQQDSGSTRHLRRCAATGLAALLLLAFAKWLNAEVGTPQYVVGLACALSSLLLFGACQGYFFSFLLDAWRWHKTTRLKR